jgi:hypothetical protein
MSRKANYFAALDGPDDEERAKALFAPSILAGGAPAFGGAQNAASHAGLPSTAASSSAAAALDLKSVVSELAEAEASLLPKSSTAAWDFSTFNDASKAAREQWQHEAAAAEAAKAEQQRLMQEHLARLHESDQERLQEKMQSMSASTKQNARRKAAKERGEMFQERLSGKAAKTAAAKRRLNQAKNLY